MSYRHPVIESGIELLKSPGKSLDRGWAKGFEQAVAVLDINTDSPLLLKPLSSVFFEQGKKGNEVAKSAPMWYRPSELTPDFICLPDLTLEPSIFETYPDVHIDDKQDGLIALERWGTFVATSADQSIPLYDLFKTAAAIHDCLKKGHGEKQCILVGCDFSGIQDTVYTITSKGALKTLRARSFTIELLCEHIIHEILFSVGSDRHAIVYSGGGGFGLLLPYNVDTEQKIKDYSRQLNDWALEEYSGRLFIAIDVLQLSVTEFADPKQFRDIRQKQADNLDRLKVKKFADQLNKLFKPTMPLRLSVATECQITRRDDLHETKMCNLDDGKYMNEISVEEREDYKWSWVSESCYHQYKLGDKLIEVTRIYRYLNGIDRSKKGNHGTLTLPGYNRQDVYYSVEEISGLIPDKAWEVNSWKGGSVFPYAKYVRKHGDLSDYAKNRERDSVKGEGPEPKNEHTASFEGLASSSCGADLIGSLRMDVDNLGDMFINIGNISLLSARSRLLNLFFKVYLNQICSERRVVTDILGKDKRKEKGIWGKSGRNVSVIYSGGDDLFIVGAWDDMVELSFDIQHVFDNFTQGQGISGGLTLHQPKFPFYHMARMSAEAENFAKHDCDCSSRKREKNRIALFYDEEKMRRRRLLSSNTESRYKLSMTWEFGRDFLINLMHEYRKCGEPVGKALDRKVFEMNPTSISYQTIEKWFMVLFIYRSRGRLCFSAMARVMKEVEKQLGKDGREIFDRLFSFLYTKAYTEESYMANLHIALNWLSYLRRSN